jgi:WhiB family redox-sensing transcriptional regulator
VLWQNDVTVITALSTFADRASGDESGERVITTLTKAGPGRRSYIMQFITTSSITVSAVPVEPDPDWHDHANCLGVDPDLFFPERGASTREAKEVCRGCEVRHDCLEFALQNGEKFGIWGGLSERERRRIRRQRAQVARSTIGA